MEKVKTSICEIIDTYAKRYEDDFPKLPIFVESVWTLLVGTSLEAKNDLLVSKAIGFLTSVVKPARHKALFSNADILNQICQNIVLPNMTLRGKRDSFDSLTHSPIILFLFFFARI